MDRVKIKNKAKEMIKDNKWFIWKPLIIFGLCFAIAEGIAFGLDSAFGLTKEVTMELFGETTKYTVGGIISVIVGTIISFCSCAFYVGYAYYVLSFVRGKKKDLKDILEFMKKHWVNAFVVILLTGLVVLGYTLLLVVPGIIAAIGLMFYQEVCADNPELKATLTVKKSWELTKGHKMDLFVLWLSFFGWMLLAGVTFGILYIWLAPYMIVTMILTYEELKK